MFADKGHTAGLDVLTAALASLDKQVGLMSLRRMLGLAKLRGATEYIVDMLDNLPPDRKVLVFAHHADVISSLGRAPRRVFPCGADRARPTPASVRPPSISS